MYLIFLSTIICQLVDQHCTAILEEPKKESQLPRLRVICVKRMKIELWLQSHCLILGNLGSYVFACFRCVTFKLGTFMNVNIRVPFLVVLMDFCQMVLVC